MKDGNLILVKYGLYKWYITLPNARKSLDRLMEEGKQFAADEEKIEDTISKDVIL